MQSPSIDLTHSPPFLGFPLQKFSSHFSSLSFLPHSRLSSPSRFSCSFHGGGKKNSDSNSNSKGGGKNRRKINGKDGRVIKVKEKENVWSIDNKLAKESETAAKEESFKGRRRRGRRVKNLTKKDPNGRVIVSKTMLMEAETVLQAQEPVIRPVWNTFASSVSGIWKGVGAVFSPITGEMEPIDIGNKNENLYDCYTLSRIEAVPERGGGHGSEICREINWVTLNPCGERQKNGGSDLPTFESFSFESSDALEEDVMGMEPGLVFFEDGSYSRGPIDIPVGTFDESQYFHSPTYKFEQCLVKGCHKRLRIVHTIEFNNGGSDIQIMRVAVYEELWDSPANVSHLSASNMDIDLKPFSQRKRIQPSDLAGSWKVFETSATPIFGEDSANEESNITTPYVYLCTETLNKRSLPENSVYFGEEEMMDMQDVALLWLPGGVTGYVDVSKDGVLCIGVGWYSDEGVNLVMERDYGLDGKLKEVRWKSEVKRRWPDAIPL